MVRKVYLVLCTYLFFIFVIKKLSKRLYIKKFMQLISCKINNEDFFSVPFVNSSLYFSQIFINTKHVIYNTIRYTLQDFMDSTNHIVKQFHVGEEFQLNLGSYGELNLKVNTVNTNHFSQNIQNILAFSTTQSLQLLKSYPVFLQKDTQTYLGNMFLSSQNNCVLHNIPQNSCLNTNEINTLFQITKILSQLTKGSELHIHNIGSFEVQGGCFLKKELFLAEIKEDIMEVKGEQNALGKCTQILQLYLNNPSATLKKQLLQVYQKVPMHLRCFVGTMEVGEIEVGEILFGETFYQTWATRNDSLLHFTHF